MDPSEGVEKPRKTPPTSRWGGVFFTFFHFFRKFRKISENFEKLCTSPRTGTSMSPTRRQKCTPTGRRSGGGAMRSIAGVNLRTCSGEHMYRYATKMYEK